MSLDDFDLKWLERISPSYLDRVNSLIKKKVTHRRCGENKQRIDIKKNLRVCKCGRKIKTDTRRCARCTKAAGQYQLVPRGRLAERPAMPDPYKSWRYILIETS